MKDVEIESDFLKAQVTYTCIEVQCWLIHHTLKLDRINIIVEEIVASPDMLGREYRFICEIYFHRSNYARRHLHC